MTRVMDITEVMAAVDAIVDVLREPDPDPAVLEILEGLPLSAVNLAKILGHVAITAAEYSLTVAGVDLNDDEDRARHYVRAHTTMPADDTPRWEVSAARLIELAATGALAPDPFSEHWAQELATVSAAVIKEGPMHTFLTIGAELNHIRRLLHGNTQGVITS